MKKLTNIIINRQAPGDVGCDFTPLLLLELSLLFGEFLLPPTDGALLSQELLPLLGNDTPPGHRPLVRRELRPEVAGPHPFVDGGQRLVCERAQLLPHLAEFDLPLRGAVLHLRKLLHVCKEEKYFIK